MFYSSVRTTLICFTRGRMYETSECRSSLNLASVAPSVPTPGTELDSLTVVETVWKPFTLGCEITEVTVAPSALSSS